METLSKNYYPRSTENHWITKPRKLFGFAKNILAASFLAFVFFGLSTVEAEPIGSARDGLEPVVSSSVSAFAQQADGKILLGGFFSTIDSIPRRYLARFNVDGSLDAGFAPDIQNTAGGEVRSIAVQADGKIVIAGLFTTIAGVSRNNLARLEADGTLDPDFDPDVAGPVNALALQADEKILVGGDFSLIGGVARTNFARINADAGGSVDTSFVQSAEGGIVHTILLHTDGTVFVGGDFSTIGGVTRNGLALIKTDDTLDLTFNPNVESGAVYTIAVQSDGKILVGGFFFSVGGVAHSYLVRLNDDGSVDGSFTTAPNYIVTSIVVQPDSKILLGGHFSFIGANPVGKIARLESDGTLDLSSPARVTGIVLSLFLQSDGKILVGGSFNFANNIERYNFARLYQDGELEGSFGWNQTFGAPRAISLLRDGKILFGNYLNSGPDFIPKRMKRYDVDGRIDDTFQTIASNDDGSVTTTAVQRDGKILIGGDFTAIDGVTRHRLARLEANGDLDLGFNPILNAESLSVLCLVVQADGKILIGGDFTTVNGESIGGIARLNGDGTVDTNFNPGVNASVSTMVVQPDGKILIAGDFSMIGSTVRNYIARLNADGTLDLNFAPLSDAPLSSIVLQPDGKILVGGYFDNLAGSLRRRIGRLNADGTLDENFNPADVTFGNNVSWIDGMALQADGKILVGGFISKIGGLNRGNIAMLNPDGSADAEFDPYPNNHVRTIVLQGDGRILVTGSFSGVDGLARDSVARLLNRPATQNLSIAADGTRLTWTRGGSSPVVESATFEVSTDEGATWTSLGEATRINDASIWELSGLNLPFAQDIVVRTSGFQMSNSYLSGSSTYESLYQANLSTPVNNNSAAKLSLRRKIGKLKRALKRFKRKKQVRKVKKIKKQIKNLTKRLRAL